MNDPGRLNLRAVVKAVAIAIGAGVAMGVILGAMLVALLFLFVAIGHKHEPSLLLNGLVLLIGMLPAALGGYLAAVFAGQPLENEHASANELDVERFAAGRLAAALQFGHAVAAAVLLLVWDPPP